MPTSDLDYLFKNIGREHPDSLYLRKFGNYHNQDELVNFIAQKVNELFDFKEDDRKKFNKLEWGIINSCDILAKVGNDKAVDALIKIVDTLNLEYQSVLFNRAFLALEDMGRSVFHRVYMKYLEDKNDPDYCYTWLMLMAKMRLQSDIINDAIMEYMDEDLFNAVNLMVDTGNKEFLPIVEEFVKCQAGILNEQELDPFDWETRMDYREAFNYINSRDGLVMLQQGIEIDHPDFDSHIEALDKELLRFVDFDQYYPTSEKGRSISYVKRETKIKRNDRCPCGSGKKYKNCCGKQYPAQQ